MSHGLDSHAVSKTFEELFAELNHAGRTIVIITHELEVAEHAKRRVFIRDGLLNATDAVLGGVH